MNIEFDNYKYEKELRQKNISFIAGVDEVGRGPLVGPVVAACVVLPESFSLDGLTDSKKLSEKKRELRIRLLVLVLESFLKKLLMKLIYMKLLS